MTHAKKHHFVPQFILRRFSDADGKLIVYRLAESSSFTGTVRNVGHRNFGHTMVMPGREPDHTSLEAAMSSIEGEAATAISKLDSLKCREVPPELRSPIAWFLALQWQRNRFLFHLVRIQSEARGHDRVDSGLYQTSLLRFILAYVVEPWRLRDDSYARPKERWNFLVSTLLSNDMHWSCYRPRSSSLVVSDTSVCFSGAREGFEPEIPIGFLDHGVGAGFSDFRRVTVPLGTKLGIVISRAYEEIGMIRAEDFNRFTVFNSREFIAHAPDWETSNRGISMSLQESLRIQRIVCPVFLWGYTGRT